jgi:hypothetical protein
MLLRWLFGLQDGDGDEELDDFTTVLYVSISVGLVLLAGLMSGLTLGLMSLDMVDLEVRAAAPPAAPRRRPMRVHAQRRAPPRADAPARRAPGAQAQRHRH